MSSDLILKNERQDDQSGCNKYLRELMRYDTKKLIEIGKLQEYDFKLDEISSFYPSFEFWELLPIEIKCMIIKEVDFFTRFSLLSCSKSMKEIAETVPVGIALLDFSETSYVAGRSEVGGSVFTVVPRSGFHSKEIIISSHCQEEGGLVRQRRIKRCNRNIGSIEKRKLYNIFKSDSEAMSFLDNILKLARYQVDALVVCFIDHVDNPGFEILDKLQVKKKLSIFESDKNTIIRLLNTAKSPLDRLAILFHGGNRDDNRYIEHETISNAKDLVLTGISVKESSLLSFKSEDLLINDYAGITDRGINTYLKRWVNGGGPDNFRKARFAGYRTDQVLNDLEYFQWDDEFRKQNTTLCNWIDEEYQSDKRCYYIESKRRNNGATLIMDNYYLVFLVTGKRETAG